MKDCLDIHVGTTVSEMDGNLILSGTRHRACCHTPHSLPNVVKPKQLQNNFSNALRAICHLHKMGKLDPPPPHTHIHWTIWRTTLSAEKSCPKNCLVWRYHYPASLNDFGGPQSCLSIVYYLLLGLPLVPNLVPSKFHQPTISFDSLQRHWTVIATDNNRR